MRLYEMGNIYIPGELPLKELPDERMQFTLGMYGEGDFYIMKGVVEEFLDKIGMKKKETYDPKAGKPFCIRADRPTSFMTEPSSAIWVRSIPPLQIPTASASGLTWLCWICRKSCLTHPSTASTRALPSIRL